MASEVLAVALNKEITNTEKVLLTVTSGHVFTVLNISICETAGAAETVDLYIDDGGTGTDYELLSDQAVGANETFELTTKFVISDEDHLCAEASAGNMDIVVSYLDQTR